MAGADADAVREVVTAWARRPGRGVVFDFNGTLSDDEPILLEVFTEIFAERLGYGLTPQEYAADLRGMSDREIVDAVVRRAGVDDDAGGAVDELLELRSDRYLAKVDAESPVRAATVALVQRLADAGVPMGIVTGAQRREVTYVLDHSPVGRHLPVVVTEEDVVRGKPDPEGFLTGASLLGLDPRDVLVFEDSVPGVTAALAAGMACLAVSPEAPSAELAALAPGVVPALDAALVDGRLG